MQVFREYPIAAEIKCRNIFVSFVYFLIKKCLKQIHELSYSIKLSVKYDNIIV